MGEVTEQYPTKFIHPPSSHLFCSICRQLFESPVINVSCGHSFCKRCICDKSEDGKTAKCPLDGEVCQLESLVLNRSVQSQIDDLDIFCCYALRWSDSEDDYVCDPDGCKAQLKYSSRKEHEDICQFGFVPCPSGAVLCGKIRKNKLQDHIRDCQHQPCPFKYKGCDYTSTAENVAIHITSCSFQTLPGLSTDQGKQIQCLILENDKLQKLITKLMSRVTELEQNETKMMNKLETTNRDLAELRTEQKKLSDRLDKLLSLKTQPQPLLSTTSTKPVDRVTESSSESSSTPSSQKSTEVWTMPFQFKCIGTLRSHKSSVLALKTHNNLLFSAGGDFVIKVWNLEELVYGCKHTMSGHTDKIQSLAVGRYLYSAGADKSIRVWDVSDFTQVMVKQEAHDDTITALICTKDYLFSSSHTVIKVWDAVSLKLIHLMSGLKHWVRCLALATNQDVLYSGSHNTIDIWHTTGRFALRGKISHSFGSVYSLAVTELYIIAGTYNNNTHLFDVRTQSYLRKLSGHVGIVQSLAVNSTGAFLFTASSDSKILLWSLQNSLLVQSLSRHEASVNNIILHNDLLISGSEDKEIKLFKYFKMQIGFVPA